jgi:predicted esterase
VAGPERARERPRAASGRLTAAPLDAGSDSGPPGLQPVEVGGEQVALAYVPPAGPRRLVVVLHGAGGRPAHALDLLRAHADRAGLLLLAPASVGPTWDAITGAYGPDVVRIDRCVTAVSTRHRVRPGTCALAGFSDGASYALSLGVANGDLVHAVVAFSPGFMAPLVRTGRVPVFVSHGTDDRVLPIDRCSRRVVPRLRADGHPVTYEEFAGGHVVPAEVVDHAMDWLTG